MQEEFAIESKSPSQWARKFTEAWWARYGYCFNCESNKRLLQMPANTPARDFLCVNCDHPYELKATKQAHLGTVTDGGYDAMMARIAVLETPTFLLMNYSREDSTVAAVATVHRVFITAESIFKRKPLPPTAKRAGWVGCNILMGAVPPEAKIGVVSNGRFIDRSKVRGQFALLSGLSKKKPEARGWMAEILTLVHRLPSATFRLHDLDQFLPELEAKFPDNKHIPEKIRQQLQILRDAGLIRFVDNKGSYQIMDRPAPQSLLR
jgi:hypothetical protein